MISSLPMVPLSRFASPVDRSVAVDPDQRYRTIGVKWWGEGAYERETIQGTQTAARTLSVVRRDDLIINKIWVRHGSTAVAGADVDGCAASGEFPTFALDRDQVSPRWLHWLSKTPWFWNQCARLSQGTSGKNRIQPDRFLTISVPLPLLAEQDRIVERVESLASRVQTLNQLRDNVTSLQKDLLASFCFGGGVVTSMTPMNQLVRLRDPDVLVLPDESYRFAGVYCFGRGVFRGDVKQGMEFSYRTLTRLKSGDFIYPKLMAWEGAFGLVPPACDGLVVSPEFPVFEVNEQKVLPEVLEVYFRMPSVWEEITDISTGTNVRRKRLQPEAFLNYKMPLPQTEAQHQARKLSNKLQQISGVHRDQQQQIDGLLPAILDKAFRGEL